MSRASDRRHGGVDRRRLILKPLIASTAVVLLFLLLYIAGRRLETGTGVREVRGDLTGRWNETPPISYDGKEYMLKELTLVLLMCIDKSAEAGAPGFRSGGQADFLMLLLIDDKNKTVLPLQIDRDTMTEITVLGVTGNASGTRNAQICISHGFGDGGAQSNRFTQAAVSEFLQGVGIDEYVSMDLNGISALNDMVGGVNVTLEDDFSSLDPVMKKGVTLTLHGDQAEYYVRNRIMIGDGTNEKRMERQKAFLKGLSGKLSARIQSRHDFMGELFDALEPSLETNMKRGRIINETWKTRGYTLKEIVRPAGSYAVGEDGFMEFHADEAALMKLVIDLFYQAAD